MAFVKLECTRRELGSKDGLQICLGGQALILRDRGDLDGALALHQQQERLCRELGSKDGLQRCLGNQANILRARGDLAGALALHQQEERLCRELGSKDGLATCLGNQALLLGLDLRRAREALPLAEEAYALTVKHGYAALAQQIAPILAKIRGAVQSSPPPPPASMPDPKADAQRVTQLNIQYQRTGRLESPALVAAAASEKAGTAGGYLKHPADWEPCLRQPASDG